MRKIFVWPDYDWCWADELSSLLQWKSDDYMLVRVPDDIGNADEEIDVWLEKTKPQG